jgi:hypothetical protein
MTPPHNRYSIGKRIAQIKGVLRKKTRKNKRERREILTFSGKDPDIKWQIV